MKEYKVDGHVSSFLPEGKNWKLVWADEFDGNTLDETKWSYRLCMMQKRHPAWGTEGVKLDGNSNAVFTVYEKDGLICSSQLQTGANFMDAIPASKSAFNDELHWTIGKLEPAKYTKKFGYFECRCKMQQKPGWWSAFWMQSPMIGASLDPATSGTEIDIMESFKPGQCIPHWTHSCGYGPDRKSFGAGQGRENLALDEYHTFACLWDETGYTYYIDGVEDGHTGTDKIGVSEVPGFILIGTEVNGYRHEGHAPTEEAKAAVGDKFIVDYVRVFDVE